VFHVYCSVLIVNVALIKFSHYCSRSLTETSGAPCPVVGNWSFCWRPIPVISKVRRTLSLLLMCLSAVLG